MNALPDPLAELPAGLVWRGERFAGVSPRTRPSGHDALDAALPGGGWPEGALIELLCAQPGIGELSLLLPLMRRVEAPRWLSWIAPPMTPYAPALAAAGVALDRLLWITPQTPRETRWATRQALLSGSCAMVLAWLERADMAALRRLQLAAETSGTPLFLFRPLQAAGQPSAAVLRLQLEAAENGQLAVRVLKRRGPLLGDTLLLAAGDRFAVRPAAFTGADQPLRRSQRSRARSRLGLSPEALGTLATRTPTCHAVARPDPARSGTASDPARVD